MIDFGTFKKFHPFLNEEIQETYTSLGEARFLAKYRDAFLSEFKNQPWVFLKKAGHRFLRAFIVPASMVPPEKSHGFYGDLKFFAKAAVYWIPLFMCIYFLFAKGIPDINTLRAGVTLFFAYLAPYVVVGFYKRYRIPLVPIFAIFYFYFFMHMREVWQRKRSRQAEQQDNQQSIGIFPLLKKINHNWTRLVADFLPFLKQLRVIVDKRRRKLAQ